MTIPIPDHVNPQKLIYDLAVDHGIKHMSIEIVVMEGKRHIGTKMILRVDEAPPDLKTFVAGWIRGWTA